jgi:hypothetical protein
MRYLPRKEVTRARDSFPVQPLLLRAKQPTHPKAR